MRYYDGKFLILDTDTGFSAGNITVAGLEALGGKNEVRLRRHETTGLVLPEIQNKPAHSTSQINLQNWIGNVIANRDKVVDMVPTVIQMIAQFNHTIGESEAQQLLNIPLEAELNKTKSVDKQLLSYAEGDMKAAMILNRLVLVDDVDYQHNNETIMMRSEDDEVRLRLPEADTIVTHQLNTPYVTERLRDVWAEPLPNLLYDYKDIVDILQAPTPEMGKQLVNKLLTTLTSPSGFNLKLEPKEIADIRDRFEVLPLDHVVGNENNDTVGILPNEQAFYDNLVAFIKWHIKRFHREVLGNIPEEELDARTEADFARGEIPVRLKEYLKAMISSVSRLGFLFTGNFLYISGSAERDSDNDSRDDVSFADEVLSEAKEAADSMDDTNYINDKANPHQSDLDVVICEYLETSAPSQGAAIWAEAIIKLMRWGSRKIKNLTVGVNNQLYLNLTAGQIASQQLANLVDFTVDVDSKGRSLEVLGATYVDFKASDSSRVRSYPFVLLGREEGYLPNVEEPISITYTTTLFDIVRQFEAGQGIVYDIEFVNGKFVDDFERQPLAEYALADVVSARRKAKVLDELKDFAVDNGIPDINGTSYAVLNVRTLATFMDTEPVLSRLDTDASTRTRIVQGAILGVFQEGAEDFTSTELVPLLNWYYENVYPTHVENWNRTLGLGDGEVEDKKVNARNFAASQLFTANDNSEEVEVEVEEEMEFMYPIYEGEPLQFGVIEKTKGSGIQLGAYALLPDGARVFAALDEVSEFSINVPTIHLGGALGGMFEVMLTADQKNVLTSRHKVLSERSIVGIYMKHLGQ